MKKKIISFIPFLGLSAIIPLALTSCSGTNGFAKLVFQQVYDNNTYDFPSTVFYQNKDKDVKIQIANKTGFTITFEKQPDLNIFSLKNISPSLYELTVSHNKLITKPEALHFLLVNTKNNTKIYKTIKILPDQNISLEISQPTSSYDGQTLNNFFYTAKIFDYNHEEMSGAVVWNNFKFIMTDKKGVEHNVLYDGSPSFDMKYKLLGYDSGVINKIIFKYNPNNSFPFSDFDLLAKINYSFDADFRSKSSTITGQIQYQILIPPTKFNISGNSTISTKAQVAGTSQYSISSIVPATASSLVTWDIVAETGTLLPTGLKLSSNGTLSWGQDPNAGRTYTFSIRATSQIPQIDQSYYSTMLAIIFNVVSPG